MLGEQVDENASDSLQMISRRNTDINVNYKTEKLRFISVTKRKILGRKIRFAAENCTALIRIALTTLGTLHI